MDSTIKVWQLVAVVIVYALYQSGMFPTIAKKAKDAFSFITSKLPFAKSKEPDPLLIRAVGALERIADKHDVDDSDDSLDPGE